MERGGDDVKSTWLNCEQVNQARAQRILRSQMLFFLNLAIASHLTVISKAPDFFMTRGLRVYEMTVR